MPKYMTKAEALREFRAYILPAVREAYEQDGRTDTPARREAWNNFTDALCKEGRISEEAYDSWVGPF